MKSFSVQYWICCVWIVLMHGSMIVVGQLPLQPSPTEPGSCGFEALVSVIPLTISSPGWPGRYPNSAHCVWNITARTPGQSVQVRFLSFNVERAWDHLTGFENNEEVFMHDGNRIPASYVSIGRNLILIFTSDSSIQRPGFQITVREVPSELRTTPPPVMCNFNVTVTRTPGILSSPLEEGIYPNDLRCTWVLTTSPNTRILLTFHLFRTEACCDRLRISEENSTEILAGLRRNTFQYLSITNQIELLFTSDSSIGVEGFNLSYVEVDVPQPRPVLPAYQVDRVVNALEAIQLEQTYIQSSYPRWYSYDYDGGNNRIVDGGFDMFDNGNNIYLSDNDGDNFQVVYNESYSYRNMYFQSYAGHPFVALAWINDEPNVTIYRIAVTGDPGSDNAGIYTKTNGTIEYGNYTISYTSSQISDANDPNICEVYFSIYNPIEWNSSFITPPEVNTNSIGSRILLSTTIFLSTGANRMQNVMFGYTLLSRYPTSLIEDDEIERVLTRMLRAILDEKEVFTTTPVSTTRVSTELETTYLPVTTTAFDDCLLTPCVNAFHCVLFGANYICLCSDGWEGQNCDRRVGGITPSTADQTLLSTAVPATLSTPAETAYFTTTASSPVTETTAIRTTLNLTATSTSTTAAITSSTSTTDAITSSTFITAAITSSTSTTAAITSSTSTTAAITSTTAAITSSTSTTAAISSAAVVSTSTLSSTLATSTSNYEGFTNATSSVSSASPTTAQPQTVKVTQSPTILPTSAATKCMATNVMILMTSSLIYFSHMYMLTS